MALPAVLNGHWVLVATDALAYAIALLGFVVLSGRLGDISLCQGELMGVGAFTAAALTENHTLPVWAATLVAMAAPVPVVLLVAVPALRLRGVNLALATLAFGVALDTFVLNTQWLSRLEIGRPAGRPAWEDQPLGDEAYYYVVVAVFVVAALVVSWSCRNRLGRGLAAVRDSENAARASGLTIWWHRLVAWALAAAVAGLAGALLAYRLGSVNFRPFTVMSSLFLFAAATIGGTTGVLGAVLGAVFFIVVPEGLTYADSSGKYAYAVYGLGILVVLLVVPGGLATAGRRARDAFTSSRGMREAGDGR